MYDDFTNIEVGQEVIIRTSRGSFSSFAKVTATTKTQFTADNRRFMKRTGCEVGSGMGYGSYCVISTPEKKAEIKKQHRTQKLRRRAEVHTLSFRAGRYTDEQLEQIVALFDSFNKEEK